MTGPDPVSGTFTAENPREVQVGVEHPPVEHLSHSSFLACRCGRLDAVFSEAFTAGQVDMREQVVEYLLRIDEADTATLVETNVYA
ncbi:hypothetical protein SCA03_29840 [Streptomyces cacaoi]|uniref:Uncharacterized protein n=1 Tax=Streptomyces cacaoi TaxID=1898 RepID=A0A4Y3R0Y3_STRCI|nr:hypothetical protein SCA03_29840 [Streptomyces cacaoi]